MSRPRRTEVRLPAPGRRRETGRRCSHQRRRQPRFGRRAQRAGYFPGSWTARRSGTPPLRRIKRRSPECRRRTRTCSSLRRAEPARARRGTPCWNPTSGGRSSARCPITLILLLVVFGALIAAGIPVVLAGSAVAATISLLAIPSRWLPIRSGTAEIVLILGMAVGVDYSLFYLRREREERAAGRSPADALRVAAATSGRAIVISGLTVMISLAGLFLSGIILFTGMAVRHHHGCRRRRGRLADRASWAAVDPWRLGRPRQNPVPWPPAAPRHGRHGCGRRWSGEWYAVPSRGPVPRR